MADVFRAIMPGAEGFKRTLVIKKILGQLCESTKFVDMFVREARISALLNHPNIVQVYDFGSVDGQYFLAMEYVRGRDVLAIIRRLRDMKRLFPTAVAAYIAHEVASCLGYAHALTGPDGGSLGIVHRDVSPSNVMCLREGGVKLLDFGIASAVSEVVVERTDQGTFKGKLAYLAPERMRNETLDGRSDLYSLGVVLWEMLACKRLFRGSSEAETFRNVLEMSIPPPSSQRPDIPPRLDAVVLHMLERDRSKRYQTGKEVADDLEDVLRDCEFRSSMLPTLLVELFGSSVHSSQVAISSLPPELLLAAGGVEPDSTSTGSVSVTPIMSRRKTWLLWVAGVAVAIALISFFGLHAGWLTHRSADKGAVSAPSKSPAAPVALPPAPIPTPPSVEKPAALGLAEPAAPALVAPVSKATRVLGGRVAKRAAKVEDDAIAKGRSIDPFVEAAKRGH
jgi:eukaryotic-like serine/threonine-protein kinase